MRVNLLGAFAPRRGRRGTVAVGLGEAFAGSTAGRGVGPSAWTALDDLLATVGAEVIAVVVELTVEGFDRDDEGSNHKAKVYKQYSKINNKHLTQNRHETKISKQARDQRLKGARLGSNGASDGHGIVMSRM